MNLLQAVKMAWKSIWGKKGRSILTILSIFIGIAAVMTIVSVMEGVKQKSREQFAAMGTGRINVNINTWEYDMEGNDISKDYFPDLYAFCNALDNVEGITPEGNLWGATIVCNRKSTDNMSYDWDDMGRMTGERPPSLYYGSDQYAACSNLILAKGRDLSYLDIQNYNQVCVMGYRAAKTFFGAGNPVGQTAKINGIDFNCVGMYAPRITDDSDQYTDNFIVIPYTTRRILGGEKPSTFIVKAKDSQVSSEVSTRIKGFLKGLIGERGDYWVETQDRWVESENEYINMIGAVLGGIAAISLLVGGIGIMNIMLVTVTERTREIGIRRAIGAQRGSIVAQFLIEAAMLCGIGGLVGIGIGTVGSVVLSTLLMQVTIYPSFLVTMEAFSLSVGLGVLFGSYPAAKASRLQPVDALRAE